MGSFLLNYGIAQKCTKRCGPFEATANGRVDERYRRSRKLTVWFEYLQGEGSAASLQILFFLSCVLVRGSSARVAAAGARNKIRSNEVIVKRERLTQFVLVIVGLLNLAPNLFSVYGSAAFQLEHLGLILRNSSG